MCMTVCTSKCWTLLVLWFLRDRIRVLFKNNFPAHNLHVKMLDFAPFTIRTWKNFNCLRYLFAQTIFTNNLLFEDLKYNYTAFNRDFKQQLPMRLVRWPEVFLLCAWQFARQNVGLCSFCYSYITEFEYILKTTFLHTIYTWRCWTLPLLQFVPERTSIVYDIYLLKRFSQITSFSKI